MTVHPSPMSSATPCDAPAREALRTEVAGRMIAHRPVLLARIRRRLDTQASTEIDGDDVFSTMLRRMDVLAASGDLVRGISDEHLLALATAIARNAVRERLRRSGRERTRLRAAGDARNSPIESDPALREIQSVERAQAEALVGRLLESDVEILGLRLRGADWPTIAGALRTTPGAAHRRYFRALNKLASLAADATPPERASTTPSTTGPSDPPIERVECDSPGPLP